MDNRTHQEIIKTVLVFRFPHTVPLGQCHTQKQNERMNVLYDTIV